MKSFLTAFLTLTPLAAFADEDRRNGPPDGYFYGTYEIVGRVLNQPTKAYAGTATLTAGDGRIAVSRCIDGTITRGYLIYAEDRVEHGSDLNGLFGDTLSVGCDYSNDGDNYARLACFIGDVNGSRPDHVGLEFYVATRSTEEDDSRICR